MESKVERCVRVSADEAGAPNLRSDRQLVTEYTKREHQLKHPSNIQ